MNKNKHKGLNTHYQYSSIDYHKFSLKVNKIIHQKWSFCFLKVKFGMLIEIV
jgi:hypothetical protein